MKTISAPPGWAVQETGGHCTALVRGLGHNNEWLITQLEDPSAPEDPNAPCVLGLYINGETEPVLQWHCSCLAEALQIAEGAKTL